MVDQLILSGIWFMAALFFLYANLKVSRRSRFTTISFALIWISAAVGLFILVRASFEYT